MATNTVGLFVQNGCSMGGNVAITGNLSVTGALTTTSFYANKPYVVCYISSSGTVSTTIKPGYVTPTVAKTTGQYVFTLPTAHPSGANYTVFVQQRATAKTTANVLYLAYVASSTSFTVWSKNTSNVDTDSDFYVYTVP